MLKLDGPLLLACNHPNSFLDAVILDILFKNPVWSLARGDAFKKPFHRRFLRKLKMLPVYRTSEGVENLENNYTTFEDCKNIFRKNGIVLMFSEGGCLNEWHLRPLKKGTARLAFSSWDEGIPLKVLPVGINYSSFRRFGKNIFINFGEIITDSMISHETDGLRFASFNDILRTELEKSVFEIDKNDKKQQAVLSVATPALLKFILFIPGLFGWILNAPLYFPLKLITLRKMRDSEFYDGILHSLVVLTYPFYLILVAGVLFALAGHWAAWLALLVIPLCAWCFVRIKGQTDHPA